MHDIHPIKKNITRNYPILVEMYFEYCENICQYCERLSIKIALQLSN